MSKRQENRIGTLVGVMPPRSELYCYPNGEWHVRVYEAKQFVSYRGATALAALEAAAKGQGWPA